MNDLLKPPTADVSLTTRACDVLPARKTRLPKADSLRTEFIMISLHEKVFMTINWATYGCHLILGVGKYLLGSLRAKFHPTHSLNI